MHSSEIARRHTFAQEIAREAGAIARRYFEAGDSIRATEKGAHDLVTEADLEIDRFLIGRLGQAFPGDGILTEESGGGEAANLWVIDPIDGTTNFSRRIPHFAMSIAFHAEGRTESGVVYNPILDEMFVARRGFGATCNGRSIRVRETRGPTDALIDAGYSSKRPLVDYVALVGRLLENGFAFVQNGSAAIGLAQLACGRIDGYCELFLHSWDVLAGLLLVEEAGGWTSDFTAGGGLLNGNAVLASTPAIREAMERILPLRSAL
ncbi:inositol monophosphatase family protein [Kaistia nematophila]|uniref:Inositol-1-monophosphatase n=1 Tax=Kaistia nematophila TaxID=2994654 RepID=A0A9X3IM84_9HYPH|nr:inositol monophosphatase family protein [Kaistia nematophila]MCX5570662.1 inositol monophosphatase family protein [Kaistia nematophila]